MENRIEIALASDDGYFCGLFVTATSMALFASRNAVLSFNILDGGISGRNRDLLEDTIRRFHRTSFINWIPVTEDMFSGLPEWRGNHMAYARLLLKDFLPDAEFVLYSDVDVLWMRDVADVWRQKERGKLIVSTVDGNPGTLAREETWFGENGIPFDGDRYFCSGLCLFNLRAMQELKVAEKCFEFIGKHQDVQYADQTVLNALYLGQVKIIDKAFQMFPEMLTQNAINNPRGVNLHYAGENPWRWSDNLQMLSDTMILWHRFNAFARSESVWRSLRRHFTACQILWHRMFFWLYNVRPVRCIASWILRKIGHGGVDYWWRVRSVRLRIPDLTSRIK